MEFGKEHIAFMKRIGVSIDFSKELRDSDYEVIENKVSAHLQKKGFDADYSPTEDGKMCEAILDMI